MMAPHLAESRLALVLVLSCLMASCGVSTRESPQMIEADGQTYSACQGLVWISEVGGWGSETTFRVKFTDAAGLSQTIQGIKKLHMSELPKGWTCAARPATDAGR
jgi:hypothetical protein